MNDLPPASHKPILITKDDITRATSQGGCHVLSLVFFDQNPPEREWYRIHDERLARITNEVIVSLFFPTGITGKRGKKHIWHQCIVSFDASYPTNNNGGLIYLSPGETLEHQNISVKIGWMHNLDALYFKRFRSRVA